MLFLLNEFKFLIVNTDHKKCASVHSCTDKAILNDWGFTSCAAACSQDDVCVGFGDGHGCVLYNDASDVIIMTEGEQPSWCSKHRVCINLNMELCSTQMFWNTQMTECSTGSFIQIEFRS